MEQQKGHVNNLLEDGWFFGNSLLSRSRSSKMTRCNSDPCSSTTKKEALVHQNPSKKISNLLRTPSLPPCFGRDTKYEHEEEDDDDDEEEEEEPRMGDLIRQAMPMSMSMSTPCRRLKRVPSLPPLRGKEGFDKETNTQNGVNGDRRLTRRVSIDSSAIGMAKLSAIDSSMVLPPKYNSKGTKQNASNSKNGPQTKPDLSITNGSSKTKDRGQNLDRSKSQKSLTDLESEELQGFKDLGFSFDTKEISPSVAQILPALQRTGSIESNLNSHHNKVRRPYLSEAWGSPSVPPLSTPLGLKRADKKPTSTEDMKAQIKFWARVVASNVRQEC